MGLAEMMYGTAQNAAQEQGQGLSQSLQQGAGLAMKKEELDLQTGQLQAKLGELKQAKLSKWADLQEKQAMMPDGPAKQAFGKFVLPQAVNAMGISDLVHPITQEMLAKDTNLANFVIGKVRDGSIPWAALGDPEKVAELSTQAGMQASGEDIKSTVANYPKEMQEAYSKWVAEQKDVKVAGIKAQAGSGYEKTVTDFSKQVNQEFSKITTEKTAMSSALAARDRISTALAKDPSGRSASPVDMGAMIYSLLHTELGRVNHTELDNQLKIPGLENMTQDQIVKYLGGVNPNTFRFLADRLNTAAQNVDKEVATKDASMEAQINAHKNLAPDEKAGLRAIKAPYSKPVFTPQAGKMYKMSNGKSYSAEQLKTLRSNPNVDPAVAAEIDSALGGK